MSSHQISNTELKILILNPIITSNGTPQITFLRKANPKRIINNNKLTKINSQN